jgi:hypothetical protein
LGAPRELPKSSPAVLSPQSAFPPLCRWGARHSEGSQGPQARARAPCHLRRRKPTSVPNALDKQSCPAWLSAIGITNTTNANCPPRVAKRLFGGPARTAQHGRTASVQAAGESLGRRFSKHFADFPYYHPNTISHKAITTQKSMKMCLWRSHSPWQ